MKTSELCLESNHPVRLLRAQGVRIHCTEGLLWLTVAGEPGDIFLAQGEYYLIRKRGLALLEAIGNARVRIEPARESLCGQLMRRWMLPGLGGTSLRFVSP